MSALHLCFDGNFINKCLEVFEKYYPGQNLFLVNKEKDQFEMLQSDERLWGIPFTKQNFPLIFQLCSENNVDRIILHGLKFDFIDCLKYLKQRIDCRVYWIFWGYELYNALGELGKYKLVDGISPFSKLTYIIPNPLNALVRKVVGRQLYSENLERVLPYVDYFCFWFQYDFDLFQRHYTSHAKFKYFKYISAYKSDAKRTNFKVYPKNICRIMVNHQASLTGNHKIVFRKLSTIHGIDGFEICTPLSYGSNYIRKIVLAIGKRYFGNKYNALLDFMPLDEYNIFLDSIPVAIFGAMRHTMSFFSE